jgi:hypothetical protein
MTRSEAETLRKRWIEEGNRPCDHPVLQLLQAELYLTGDYVCERCGEEVGKVHHRIQG